MALRQSKQILAGYPVPNPTDAVDCVPITAEILVPVGGFGVNDVLEMGGIAEGMIAVDAIVVCEDLDSNGTPLIQFQAGFLSGVYGSKDSARTCGADFFAASSIGQTGGMVRANVAAGFLQSATLDIVPFGLKITAAAATPTVGARIRMTVWARPAPVSI